VAPLSREKGTTQNVKREQLKTWLYGAIPVEFDRLQAGYGASHMFDLAHIGFRVPHLLSQQRSLSHALSLSLLLYYSQA